MIWVVLTIFACYFIFLALILIGWKRTAGDGSHSDDPAISVVIAVRNEQQHIGQLLDDLSLQAYSTFEVIIVDDHSDDDTRDVIFNRGYHFQKYHLNDGHGKKAAITYGIAVARGEIIVTTDGDCRVPPGWLQVIAKNFSEKVNMLAGPVRMTGNSFFERLQTIEFASLIGSAASLISWHIPTMCNGANLAYRKSVFEKVNGFAGNDHVASGDDEFLMRKIHEFEPGSITFLKDQDAIVSTASQPTVKRFASQRIRWASKWKLQTYLPAKLIGFFVFLAQLSTVAAYVLVAIYPAMALALVLRFVIEAVVLRTFMKFLKIELSVSVLAVVQLIYPFYVVTIAVLSFFSTYAWKGRIYVNQ